MDTTPLLFIESAIITLFNEIPKEEDEYEIFQPPFDVLKKYRLEPPKTGLLNNAELFKVLVNEVRDL